MERSEGTQDMFENFQDCMMCEVKESGIKAFHLCVHHLNEVDHPLLRWRRLEEPLEPGGELGEACFRASVLPLVTA